MRTIARTAWRRLLAALPTKVVERLFRSWVNVLAEHRPPAAALRELFALDDDLQRKLDRTALRYDGGVHVKNLVACWGELWVEARPPELHGR